jgi:hypothetical protein
VLFVAVLHFVGPDDKPYEVVGEYVDALAPGSYIGVSHSTADGVDDEVTQKMTGIYSGASARVYPRSRTEVTHFLDGLDTVSPGIVNVARWRMDLGDSRPVGADEKTIVYGGIGKRA